MSIPNTSSKLDDIDLIALLAETGLNATQVANAIVKAFDLNTMQSSGTAIDAMVTGGATKAEVSALNIPTNAQMGILLKLAGLLSTAAQLDATVTDATNNKNKLSGVDKADLDLLGLLAETGLTAAQVADAIKKSKELSKTSTEINEALTKLDGVTKAQLDAAVANPGFTVPGLSTTEMQLAVKKSSDTVSTAAQIDNMVTNAATKAELNAAVISGGGTSLTAEQTAAIEKIYGSFSSKQELLYNSLFQSSSLNSRTNYEDTALSLFADTFIDLSNWSTTTKLQVLDNKVYSTTGSGGSSGINHSYPISSTEKMRAIIRFNIPSGIVSGGIIIGVSTDAAGAVPLVTAGNVYGLYLSVNGVKQANAGSFTDLINPQLLTVGEYIAVITIDANYISVVATNISNPNIEYAMRVSRDGISVNNIYIFNSDSRTTTGSYISNVSARKGLGSLYPRHNIEGIVKTIQWTGNGIDNFRVYLPKDYDSRRTYPCIIGFHGLGTNEYQWSINGNMVIVQKALVDAGYIFLTCSYSSSSSTWGNKLGTTSYYKGYKYLIDNYSISSIGFYCNSMGGIESLNAICNEQIPCSVWVGTSPSSNLKNIYDTEMFTSGVKTAYSISSDGSDYEEKTNGFDPMLNNINKFKGIPMLFIAADDDAAVNTVNNTDLFLSKISPYSLEARKISVATGGHSFNNSPYLTNITAFFNKYLKNIY